MARRPKYQRDMKGLDSQIISMYGSRYDLKNYR